ncbi:LacI family transcriptional regulator [Microlunatus endophyticus]|uniref:LacI family transcriptional regulator n=1 Tax=Microlunatus endophyticus TaxID=1716077 RepID=A0A917W7N3_9ACTN|nr:LacI family DNA-binding transcriptional regulator [Microlunatus endophyticus]GGL75136.1 LacI family transcriptional regulator [Microlunatus endophyticus]
MTYAQPDKPARTTLRMVAELAGVSTATVSYVLSGRTGGRTGVSEATMTRVRQAAQELNYHPNQAARAIRTGRTNLVLLSLTMLSDPWSQELSRSVSEAVTPSGLTALILADGDWATAITRQPCDVAFIDNVRSDKDREDLRRLARSGYRLVVFDDQLEPDGFDVVHSDATEGCRLAVRHLLESHQRIGCLTTELGRRLVHRRYAVYLEELQAAGIEIRDDYVETIDLDPSSAYAAAMRMLSRPDRPDAIYAISDFAAISAVQAALRLRLRVPEDVAVIGVGNTLDGERLEPSLSSVGPTDFYVKVAEILRQRATGEVVGAPTTYDFSWSLFPRESTVGRRT